MLEAKAKASGVWGQGQGAVVFEAKAKAKARHGRGQAKAKSAKTSDYRVLEREITAKVVFLMPWKFTLHNFGIKTINDITIWK